MIACGCRDRGGFGDHRNGNGSRNASGREAGDHGEHFAEGLAGVELLRQIVRRAGDFLREGDQDFQAFDRVDPEVGFDVQIQVEHLVRITGALGYEGEQTRFVVARGGRRRDGDRRGDNRRRSGNRSGFHRCRNHTRRSNHRRSRGCRGHAAESFEGSGIAAEEGEHDVALLLEKIAHESLVFHHDIGEWVTGGHAG